MSHSIENIRLFQNKSKPEECLDIHFYLRFYLIVATCLSGLLAGMTSTMGKMWLETVSFEKGFGMFFNYQCWITGLSVAFTVYANLTNLNMTISLFPQLQVLPAYECCVILGILICGGIIMKEFSMYTVPQIVMIFIGSSIAIIGIMFRVSMLEEEDDVAKSQIFMDTVDDPVSIENKEGCQQDYVTVQFGDDEKELANHDIKSFNEVIKFIERKAMDESFGSNNCLKLRHI